MHSVLRYSKNKQKNCREMIYSDWDHAYFIDSLDKCTQYLCDLYCKT